MEGLSSKTRSARRLPHCLALALLVTLCLPLAGAAQEDDLAAQGADELARKSSNPLGGDFWIILNQVDNYFMTGDLTGDLGNSRRTINTWALQPVIPVSMANLIGENWIWVNRPTFPFIMNADIPDSPNFGFSPPGTPPQLPPGFEPPGGIPPGGVAFDSIGGFGDIIFFSMIGKSDPKDFWGGGDLVYAVGLTQQFPSASNKSLGTGKYSLGPAAVLSFIGKRFVIGALYQQWIDVATAGKGSGADQNFSWLNVFYFLNFPGGWQLGGTPVITADWESQNSKQRWTVPLGLGVYKTHFFGGKLPMKVGIEGQYMPVQPDAYGQEYNIRLVLAPIIPSFF